jgi:hypothetical protein
MRKAAMRVRLPAFPPETVFPSRVFPAPADSISGAQAKQRDHWGQIQEQGVEWHGSQHGQSAHAEAGPEHDESHEIQGATERHLHSFFCCCSLEHLPDFSPFYLQFPLLSRISTLMPTKGHQAQDFCRPSLRRRSGSQRWRRRIRGQPLQEHARHSIRVNFIKTEHLQLSFVLQRCCVLQRFAALSAQSLLKAAGADQRKGSERGNTAITGTEPAPVTTAVQYCW